MTVTTFAAIDIGSYEVCMKIFELSRKNGFRELNHVRYRLEIGKGAYSSGRLEQGMVDAICERLKDFRNMMLEFGVTEYRACSTSAFREMVNPVIILEQIYQRTGIRVEILSNAEQHFLGYKSIAAIESGFKKIIQKGTAILDVGGGGLQVSLFDKDTLVTTQSLKMGSMRIRERLKELEKANTHYDQLIREFIRNDLTAFQRLYLKDRDIKNVILMGDFLTDTIFREEIFVHIITMSEFSARYEDTVYKTDQMLAAEMDIDPEYASLVVPTMVICKSFLDVFQAEAVWERFGGKKEDIKVIGIRHGEKIYETLLTNEECAKAEDMGNFYRVPADNRGLNYDKFFKEGETERNTLTEFNSNNTYILNVEEAKAKIAALDYIKKELSGEGNFIQ